ncbi:MAG: hypothetical protein Q4C95_01440 [Planctomycetia bacterium]|nr:hypothetical protein [Planctomycetia bacterium]
MNEERQFKLRFNLSLKKRTGNSFLHIAKIKKQVYNLIYTEFRRRDQVSSFDNPVIVAGLAIPDAQIFNGLEYI